MKIYKLYWVNNQIEYFVQKYYSEDQAELDKKKLKEIFANGTFLIHHFKINAEQGWYCDGKRIMKYNKERK